MLDKLIMHTVVMNKARQYAAGVYCRLDTVVTVILMLLLLAACSTSPQEVVIRDVSDSNRTATTRVDAGVKSSSKKTVGIDSSGQNRAGDVNREPVTNEVQPVYSASARQKSPLQKKLLTSAQKKLSANEPQAAIVLAEKGLRIDRKDPQFYILLARAYEQLGDKQQSSYFARQGLRYVRKGSEEYQVLKRLAA
jgi:Flp pilus assembly protein TadD